MSWSLMLQPPHLIGQVRYNTASSIPRVCVCECVCTW
jgi:hypothetical protein